MGILLIIHEKRKKLFPLAFSLSSRQERRYVSSRVWCWGATSQISVSMSLDISPEFSASLLTKFILMEWSLIGQHWIISTLEQSHSCSPIAVIWGKNGRNLGEDARNGGIERWPKRNWSLCNNGRTHVLSNNDMLSPFWALTIMRMESDGAIWIPNHEKEKEERKGRKKSRR